MVFGVDSIGVGHGRCGHGPMGNGPWLTFPFTPGFVATAELGYAVTAVPLENGMEHRILRSRDRALSLSYHWPTIDSATALAVSSLYQALDSFPARVIVADYPLGVPQVGRVVSGLTLQQGPAMAKELELTFRIERPLSYAQAVLARTPALYLRFNEPRTQVSSVLDAASASATGAPFVYACSGMVMQQAGALAGDRSYAVQCSGAAPAHISVSSLNVLAAPMTLELWFKQRVIQPSSQTIFHAFTGSGTNFALSLANGFLMAQQYSATCTSSLPFVSDNQWHYLGWSMDVSSQTFCLDGRNVTPLVTSQQALGPVTSASIASKQLTTGFDGMLDEIAVYNTALSLNDMAMHAAIGRGI